MARRFLIPNSSSVLSAVLNSNNIQFEHECLGQVLSLLIAPPIHQSIDARDPGNVYSISGPPGTKFLAQQVWALQSTVRRCDWESDMPGELVAEEMGLGKMLTSVAAGMMSKLLTNQVIVGWLLSAL